MNLLPPAQVFVLMVTAIGSSLFYTLKSLVERPGEIFSLLATTLPYSTHFYLSYFPFQWCCCHLLQIQPFFFIPCFPALPPCHLRQHPRHLAPWLRTVYAAEVTRYHVAVKYFALKALRGAERAIEACEPEDQAHYGRPDFD